LNTQEV